MNAGDWSKAEEFGASEEEITNHGGIKVDERVVTEGPETWTETVWAGEPTAEGDAYGIGDAGEFDTGSSGYSDTTFEDHLTVEDDPFADPGYGWQNDEYDWASEAAYDAWGNWEDSYSDTGWYDDSGGYTDDGWSENAGGIINRRPGTNPAMYRAGGGMSKQQQRYNDHPGGPRGTDTVPAWLTEGEFVIDKDSTEKFAPLLKKINDWEPSSGPALKRKMRDDKINAKAFGTPMYRQEGGDVDPFAEPTDPGDDAFARQKKEAFLAKSGRARGANIGAGLDALGKSNINQAKILGSAGLQGTPIGQLENVYGAAGAGAAAAGQAEGQYHDKLGEIAGKELERSDVQAKAIAAAEAQGKKVQSSTVELWKTPDGKSYTSVNLIYADGSVENKYYDQNGSEIGGLPSDATNEKGDSPDDAGLKVFQEEEAKNASEFGKDINRQLQAANQISQEISIIVPLLERSPRVVGIFNTDEGQAWAGKFLGSMLTALQTGVETPWGPISLDLSDASATGYLTKRKRTGRKLKRRSQSLALMLVKRSLDKVLSRIQKLVMLRSSSVKSLSQLMLSSGR